MGLSDYSSLENEIRNAPEPHCLPDGREAKVRITRVQEGVSQKEGSEGAAWFMPYFDCPDDPMVKEFNWFIWDPLPSNLAKLDSKQEARTKDSFNKFTQCFKIDISKPFDWGADLPGKTGWIIPGVQNDPQYGDKNTIRKFITGPKQRVASDKLSDDDIHF